MTAKSNQGPARTNPAAKLIFEPLPAEVQRPVLQRPMLRPNVLGIPQQPAQVLATPTGLTQLFGEFYF